MGFAVRLNPKKTDRIKEQEPYSVCDIEVAHWTRFLVIGHYDGKKFRHFNRISKYFDYVFNEPYLGKDNHPSGSWNMTKHGLKRVVYAHFGGKFDFMFLLDHLFFHTEYEIEEIIPRGSSLLCFEAVKPAVIKDNIEVEPERTIMFRDSAAMLPFGLRSLCESFHVDHLKLDIDYTKIKKVTAKLVRYLMHDCKGLYEVIEKYYGWDLVKRAGPSFTIAGQAMKVLKTMIDEPIYSLPPRVDHFVRKAYYGGRTEMFRPVFDGHKSHKKISCFDINSLYPTVMRLFEYAKAFDCFTSYYDPTRIGVFDAEVEVPESMWIPPLGVNHIINGKVKYIFPVGRFKGRWTTQEIEYARSVGVKILKTGNGALFHSGGRFFEKFVDTLYEIKQQAAPDSVDYVLAKLLLNSCYGRFGLILERENVVLDRGQAGARAFAEFSNIQKRMIKLVKEPKVLRTFNNVMVACGVTSNARIHMHPLFRKCGRDLYYTDTDSIFTSKNLGNVKGLGGMKCEYSAKTSCFLLPKTYIMDEVEGLKSKEGVEITKKVVMKGFDKKKIKDFELSDFTSALEGDLRRLIVTNEPKFATFKTAVAKGGFIRMTQTADPETGEPSTRQIRATYDKRTIVKAGTGFSTKPLCIDTL
jgi:hypothetical protein